MSVLVFDTENTGATNGTIANPFTSSNRLCLLGCYFGDAYYEFDVDYSRSPNGEVLRQIQSLVDQSRLLVGFNLKYDLHWLRRYGINFSRCSGWDTQLVHFILTHHRHPDPSLAEVAQYHGLDSKLDVVRTEYWDNGIDTDKVPWTILSEYAKRDVDLTRQIFLLQSKQLQENSKLRKVCWISCQDLLVTEEMEANGLKADFELMSRRAKELRSEIAEIDKEINKYVPVGCSGFNWNSGEHLSALLYGGICRYKEKQKYLFTYKDGRTAEKERWMVVEHTLPGLVKPLEGTKLAKDGYFQTNEDVLLRLPKRGEVKGLVSKLLERAGLEKKVGTYYEGLQKTYVEMGWEEDVIHGNLNHCRAATSRLSSSRPNQQNMDKEVLECLISRF